MHRERSLVTGGAGFVGSHLCERLLAQDHLVIALDDLSTGRMGNIEHLLEHPSFHFVHGDVREEYDFDITRIYNLASAASPVHYQADPIKTTLTNVVGTLNGLRVAQRRGARFLQASTSEVYGDPLEHPQRESYHGNVNPIGIRACYDEGKRCAESLAIDFSRAHGVHVKIARIFNTYGPRMAIEDGRVVTNFIVSALSNSDITVFGDGSQTRSFCYIDDLVRGLCALMDHPEAPYPFNLGNPKEMSVLELARAIIAITGSRSRIVHRPLPEDDPKKRRPDISLARERLGFLPKVPLEIGLRRTVESIRERLSDIGSEASSPPAMIFRS